MAAFQIPAGFLAERWGERRLLAAGTRDDRAAGSSRRAGRRLRRAARLLLVAGLGSGVQHPLSSSLVSKAYETGRAAHGARDVQLLRRPRQGRRRRPPSGSLRRGHRLARGAAPPTAWSASPPRWRIVPLLSRLGAGASRAAGRSDGRAGAGERLGHPRHAAASPRCRAIGMIDNATRTGFLTFLPFLLIAKGSTVGGGGPGARRWSSSAAPSASSRAARSPSASA